MVAECTRRGGAGTAEQLRGGFPTSLILPSTSALHGNTHLCGCQLCSLSLWFLPFHSTRVPHQLTSVLTGVRGLLKSLPGGPHLLPAFGALRHSPSAHWRCLSPLLVHIPPCNQSDFGKPNSNPPSAAARFTLLQLPPKLGRGNHEVNSIFLPPCFRRLD